MDDRGFADACRSLRMRARCRDAGGNAKRKSKNDATPHHLLTERMSQSYRIVIACDVAKLSQAHPY
jgi:hypothetical protein